MRPSEIREKILEEHTVLRQLLNEMEELTRRVLTGETGAAGHLRQKGARLREFFLEHLDHEDAWLVPALRQTDSWGEERASRVEREHRDQRAKMDMLLRNLSDPGYPSGLLADELRELTAHLKVDMEHEERSVLDEKLLRDDVITTDVESG